MWYEAGKEVCLMNMAYLQVTWTSEKLKNDFCLNIWMPSNNVEIEYIKIL